MFALALLFALSFGPRAADVCTGFGDWSGCDLSNSGSEVSIGGSITTPGGNGAPYQPAAPWSNSGNVNIGSDGDSGAPSGPPPSNIDLGAFCGLAGACTPPPAVVDEPAAPIAPSVDYSAIVNTDLVSFSPASATATVEPSGLGIAGMPVNIVASASPQTLHGELFGQPIAVQFDPVAFTFDYGDGTIRDTNTGGQSWEALGVPQFSATTTSHAYANPGDYTVAITVHYGATIQAPDGTWFPVAGTVSATASAHGIRVFEVSTALVQHTCAENPSGPGC